MMKMGATLRSAVLLALALGVGCKSDAADPGDNFSIRPGDVTLRVGQSQQFSATGAPGPVTWSASNAAVTTIVPETGFVTAVGPGESRITAQSGSVAANATVTVTVPPALALSTPTVEFEMVAGGADPNAQTVSITNAGGDLIDAISAGPVQYAEGQPEGWLTIQLSGVVAPATLTLRATAGQLPAGTYSAVVPVRANAVANSPQNVAVTFRILAPPSIVLSRTDVAMFATPGQSVQQSVDVTNGGDVPLTGLTASIAYDHVGSSWLAAALNATTAPTQLVLTANAAGLPQGTHTATVTVASSIAGVAAKTVAVALTVGQAPAIVLSRGAVQFSSTAGGSPQSQNVTVTNGGGGTLNDLSLGATVYSAGTPTQWLTTSIDRPLAPATITLNANPAGLANGTYTATVPVLSAAASNSPANITVTLTIGNAPVIAVNPTSLKFTTFEGGNAPNAQAISVTNAGGGTLSGLSYSIEYGPGAAGWLGIPVWQSGTTAPATLLVQPALFPRGTYTATITISAGAGIAPRQVDVTYTVSSFTVDVAPLFITQSALQNPGSQLTCSNCHAVSTPSQAYNFARPLVSPGNPNTGSLVCRIEDTCRGPSNTNMGMSAAAISLIKAWITAGAPSN